MEGSRAELNEDWPWAFICREGVDINLYGAVVSIVCLAEAGANLSPSVFVSAIADIPISSSNTMYSVIPGPIHFLKYVS